jgi:hypothetical protein
MRLNLCAAKERRGSNDSGAWRDADQQQAP